MTGKDGSAGLEAMPGLWAPRAGTLGLCTRGSLAAVLSPSTHTSDVGTSEDAAWALIFHNGFRVFLAYPGWRITPKQGETRTEMPLKWQERKTQRE